ncbi:variable surface lipoprotein [Mycoplasmopsis primatum]|uniref:variable surface lipoprotein n=1 Tax=Mycoplasmopsis primatum TaxID=55604 RepID=UPI0004983094|nr:variable surface lipoprotein [Mycoplasmopsis primatum]
MKKNKLLFTSLLAPILTMPFIAASCKKEDSSGKTLDELVKEIKVEVKEEVKVAEIKASDVKLDQLNIIIPDGLTKADITLKADDSKSELTVNVKVIKENVVKTVSLKLTGFKKV